MQQAVIETGGKQYLVSPDDKITIEKLPVGVGEPVVFDKVLLITDGGKVNLGKPFVDGSKVTGKVLSQGRGKKIVVYKYKAKSRYRRKQGHRQDQSIVQIEKIS
ncbi:MAG: 50S ribosomal protein L21 [Candidatus Doudnabacteria bacterium]|nr:50S ribosomal protein L21 [Candidatus Doudnabacteria bacterium]